MLISDEKKKIISFKSEKAEQINELVLLVKKRKLLEDKLNIYKADSDEFIKLINKYGSNK